MTTFEGRLKPVYMPALGDLATDIHTGRVGYAIRWDGSTLRLRAPNGEEWGTTEFRRPTTRERLVPQVAEANRRSRGA